MGSQCVNKRSYDFAYHQERFLCDTIAFTLINKDAKGGVVSTSTVFGPVDKVASPEVILDGTF